MTSPSTTDLSPRTVALLGGVGLLCMAILAAFASFGVLQRLVVRADADATLQNIVAHEGLFRAGVAAWLLVVVLDVLVAWALYVVLRPVNEALALFVGWLRLIYAAALASAAAHLVDVAQTMKTLEPEQAMSAIASFENGWKFALAIFGFHLLGLGALLWRATFVPRWLALLVVVAGAGYLVDSFGFILVPGSALAVSEVTFVGEALLIFWLPWRALKGFPNTSESQERSRGLSRAVGAA